MSFTPQDHAAALARHRPEGKFVEQPPISRDPADRIGYIGGTDIQHVLAIEPYGCPRRLWYQKTGATEDRPFKMTAPIVAGNAYEAYVAELVKERTGWTIRRKKATANGHELQRIDREIVGQDRGPGILEIKTVSDRAYWDWKRDGVPVSYQLQIQWYMRVLKRTWAVIAAFNRDTGQLDMFDFEARPEFAEAIAGEANKFMESVERQEAPPWLAERDGRCDSCQWEATCQMDEWAHVADGGLVQIDGLPPLMAEYKRLKGLEKQVEENLELLREGDPSEEDENRRLGIDALMGDNEQARASADERALFKVQETWRVDTELLKTKYADVYAVCQKRSVSRPLRIFKIKGAK